MMENIAVLGSGTMGHSIALSVAWSNHKVKVYSINLEDLKRAETEIDKKLLLLYKNALISDVQMQTIKNNITLDTHLEAVVEDSTFIIEAVPEDLSIKSELYEKLNDLLYEKTILASNTSGFTLQQLTKNYKFPNHFIITHFWNPAHLVPLVEIVKNEDTDIETVARTENVINAIGKKPILIQKEISGFIGNRLQYALFREAQSLFDQGVASKEDIDAAVTYSVGRRYPVVGPLMTADLGGLDVFSAISDYLFEDLSTEKASGKTLSKHVDEGNLGYKTGKGFYDWDESESQEIIDKRDEVLMYFLKKDQENN